MILITKTTTGILIQRDELDVEIASPAIRETLPILIDVLIVRMVIAPAVVTLLGDRAWWLPAWLDRILPNVSLEGHLVQGLDEKTAEEERVKVHA